MARSNMMSDMLYGSPSSSYTFAYDPYAQDRPNRMQVLEDRQGELANLKGLPPWMLDPETQAYIDAAIAESVYSAHPRAGGSEAVDQLVSDQQMRNRMEQVKMRLALEESLRKSIDQNAMTSWGTAAQSQYVPAQPGLLQSYLSSATGGAGAKTGEAVGQGIGQAGGGIWDMLLSFLGSSNQGSST
jgi:hypothetical protein